MKFVFLHGLGQTAQDWQAVVGLARLPDADCPELFALANENFTYPAVLAGLEKLYAQTDAPLALCGLSLGALLALDYTARHPEKVASLVLVGAQYRAPTALVDLQNVIFRLMPAKAFDGMGLPKSDVIKFSRSMRSLNLGPQLGGVACPVTVVCGEKDRANRRASEQLKALLPQAALHIVAGAGHEVNRSAPEELAAILKSLT